MDEERNDFYARSSSIAIIIDAFVVAVRFFFKIKLLRSILLRLNFVAVFSNDGGDFKRQSIVAVFSNDGGVFTRGPFIQFCGCLFKRERMR